MKYRYLLEEVYEANLALPKLDLVVFTWGNVSQVDREKGVVAIKPSGVSYDEMQVEDIVVVDLETAKVIQGKLKPSSDTLTHLALYKAFETVSGVCHTHAPWSVSWAQSGRGIPPYGTTHADAFYGEVPCTRALTEEEIKEDYELNTGLVIIERFKEANIDPMAVPAALITGHGPFTWGKSAMDSVEHAKVLEECAKMAARAERLNPEIKPIPQALLDKHYFRKHGDNAYYGQK